MSAPLYILHDGYPTTPMATFPPPLPNAHPPLRVRCGVTMRLHLSTHGLSSPAWPSPKGHVQPHRNHLPRRRNPRRVVLHDHEETRLAQPVLELEAEVPALVVEEEKSEEKAPTEETLVGDGKPVPKGHVEPHRSHLPRRRKVRRVVLYDTDDDKPVAESCSLKAAPAAEEPVQESVSVMDEFAPVPLADQSQLQVVLPFMSIAYVEDDALEYLPGNSADEPYTHIVSIRYGESSGVSRSYENRCTYLRFTFGPRDSNSRRAGLGLSDAQLRAARDFLAELCPHLHTAPSGVRILIATPPEHPTDAMCMLACYLAFVTGKDVDGVLRAIDTEEGFLSTWKGEVSEDEVEKVEKIARAWSWMSQIVKPNITA
ncbi:uncharacterized protein PHACADRAFT_260171 [Phanerochaete carnosa HHB-10118-sp]|uniref:Uncharacterized protein n=1 Tax=Phanerochaete carnosa (strain HHB-10118-sp) TaxID=650164 RepID=K5WTC9_PHACS|nr:uncharacterized protein PHACADRAFT_260171 [Phanerochaete carnosa HHB-10118-sp]EKM53687.1 hypothetical protein PHACADRAFT_260171 [Phanerochaete carnosa HHB-10118-sp]